VGHFIARSKYDILHDHNYPGTQSSKSYYKFTDVINEYHVIAVAETRISSYDNVTFKGYTVFPQQHHGVTDK
jgi:hypothetical protein